MIRAGSRSRGRRQGTAGGSWQDTWLRTSPVPPGGKWRGGGRCHVPVDGGTQANQSSTGCHARRTGEPSSPHCPAEMLCLKHVSVGGKHLWLGMRYGEKEETDSGKQSGTASWSSQATCPFPALAPLAVVLSLLFGIFFGGDLT